MTSWHQFFFKHHKQTSILATKYLYTALSLLWKLSVCSRTRGPKRRMMYRSEHHMKAGLYRITPMCNLVQWPVSNCGHKQPLTQSKKLNTLGRSLVLSQYCTIPSLGYWLSQMLYLCLQLSVAFSSMHLPNFSQEPVNFRHFLQRSTTGLLLTVRDYCLPSLGAFKSPSASFT